MMKYVLIFFFISCFAQAQAKELSNDYSHVSVTITGYACSVISKGIINDSDQKRWYLPDEVIIPSHKGTCTSKNIQSREKSAVAVTVIAIAEKPGAIKAKAGTINIIATPTAGWLAVTNKEAAIVGVSMDEQCQQVLNTNKQSYLYTDMGLQDLITVYDKDGIIVYVDEKSILETVNNPYGKFNGNFGATLIFVFKDKKIRLSAIEEIKRSVSITENFNCQRAINTPQGTTYERGLSCADVNGTAEGKIDILKYIMIQGAYYQTGIRGVVTRDGSSIPGPVFNVNNYLYLAPLRCAAIKEGYNKNLRKEDREDIIGTDRNNPTLIYNKSLGFNISEAPQWVLFFGELHPLATATFGMLKMGTDQTPVLNQVIKNIQDLIIEKQGK